MDEKPTVYLPPAQRKLAVLFIMLATILVVLDQTIANVALPHMQAALGATPDTVSWVLTSYVLASAVATPMTGWLSGRFGRRQLFCAAVVGFTLMSAICGMAVSLPMMVAARVAQGFFGAFLIPMSQAFMYDLHPPSQQVRASTTWGLGVMVAPIIGPLVGGYLTELLDWRWVFFVNLPLGAIAVVGLLLILPQFSAVRRPFDHLGFALIAIGLCSMQLVLDRGTQQDWFDSVEILIEAGLSISALWLLIFHLRTADHPLIPIALFTNRSYVVGLMMGFIVSPILIAGSALLPSLLQTLLGYPVELTGLLVVPRGLAFAAAMVLGSRLMTILDGRVLIFAGLLLIIWSMHLQTLFNLQMGWDLLVWSGILQGVGMGLSMTILTYIAVSGLPAALRTEGAAVFNLARTIGTSVMIAISTAMLARNLQISHADVGSSLRSNNLPFSLSEMIGGNYLSERVAAMANAEVTRQAMMISYIDDFWLMMWASVCALPLVLLLKPIRAPKGEPIAMME